MKTCVELWIPKHIYELVIEECNIMWVKVSYNSYYGFVNSFGWSRSRQWWMAWANAIYRDFYLINKRIKDNWWSANNNNDFYINMMKD